MLPKKNIPFNCKQIGVFIFFILNCLLTAAPFVNASAQSNTYSESPGNIPQDRKTAEPEDNSRSNYSEVQEYHFSVRAKRCINQYAKAPGNYSLLSNNIDKISSGHYFASSSFIVRPAYYTFLSLHNLF